ncbi:unnamed protein product, partial [marine sediment metagenome]
VITIKTKGDSFKVIDSEERALPHQKENKDTLHIYMDKIPALGYKTIYLKSSQKKSKDNQDNILLDKVVVNENIMENQYLQIKINENGSIDVWDKVNKREYRDLSVISDGADAGDEYNYSFPENNITITNENIKAEIEVVEKSFLKAVVKISIILQLPESLTDDRKNRSKKLRDFPIINWVTLEAKSPILNFRTVVKNTVKDHRLRVLFPTGIDTKYSFAGTQFDVTKHEITPKTFDNSDISEDVKRVIIGAREPEPITTFPQYYFVDVNNKERGIA